VDKRLIVNKNLTYLTTQMKNILSILLVSVLLIGCSKEDEIQDTVLDSDLFGNWSDTYGSYCYDMTLSSNGKFVYQSERCSDGNFFTSNSGQWWVEGDHLVLSGDSWGLTDYYSVNGSSLDFDGQTWEK